MKVFTSAQIRELDAYTIQNEPIASIDLMERAALACTNWISAHYSNEHQILVFCGPGNNGGDGLAIARQLNERGFNVKVFFYAGNGKTSADFRINLLRLQQLGKAELIELSPGHIFPVICPGVLIIDALFGSGLSRPAEGFPAEIIMKINGSGAEIISIDLPSGLAGDSSPQNHNESIIRARHTLSFQFPKLAFFFAENSIYVGDWLILPIGLNITAIENKYSDFNYIDLVLASELLKKRSKFSHKGTYGHALLIAGSQGMMGASVLASRACMRAGAGLITAHVPYDERNILQISAPEALVSLDESPIRFTQAPDYAKFSAVAVGPGLGTDLSTHKALQRLLETCNLPMLLDADALNIIANNKDWLKLIPGGSILTPHPGEFGRLFGKYERAADRNRLQIEISKRYSLVIVLKGANTSISCPDGSCWFNSTGNPGMATGGSGDVLTGIILSLLAQGYSSKYAAILGTFVHGLAGDLARMEEGEEGLIASDIIKQTGKAFKLLKNNQ